MTAPRRSPAPGHVVEADDYCRTCCTVPCTGRPDTPASRGEPASQLDRIEIKLNRILRRMGEDPDDLTALQQLLDPPTDPTVPPAADPPTADGAAWWVEP